MMNAMCGIETSAVRSPFQGSTLRLPQTQGVALGYDRPRPWHSDRPAAQISFFRPKGANYRSPGQRPGLPASPDAPSPERADHLPSANGANYRSPGQRHGLDAHPEHTALKGRQKSPAPTGRFIVAQGNALGNRPFIRKAPKGRPKPQRMEEAE